MSRGPTGPRRIRAQRDRTVGRSRVSSSAHSTIVTPGGGSSSVLSRAALRVLVHPVGRLHDRDACPTLEGQEGQIGDEVADAAVLRLPGPPMTTWPPGPSGPRRCRSGWSPRSTRRQPRHDRQGRTAGSDAVHRSPAARSSASVVLPTPPGPAQQDRVRRAARTMASIAASAAPWPRVRAPSTVRLSRRRAWRSRVASERPWEPPRRHRTSRRSSPSSGSCGSSERPWERPSAASPSAARRRLAGRAALRGGGLRAGRCLRGRGLGLRRGGPDLLGARRLGAVVAADSAAGSAVAAATGSGCVVTDSGAGVGAVGLLAI